jgi:predicted Zn-dependent protease
MIADASKLNIVRIGSDITYSSLKEIGDKILESFRGIIEQFRISHHNTPVLDSIDPLLLTMVLHEEFGGHTLGITDADLRTQDEDEFYNSIFGGKNSMNDVAVVSTRKLSPEEIKTDTDYELYINRTVKVSLHEVGHNLGLTDHPSYKKSKDGTLCPMSKGEYNRFGYRGYVRAIIDGRGMNFCDECTSFMQQVYKKNRKIFALLADGLIRESTLLPN